LLQGGPVSFRELPCLDSQSADYPQGEVLATPVNVMTAIRRILPRKFTLRDQIPPPRGTLLFLPQINTPTYVSNTDNSGSEKQAAHAWGAPEGKAELNDEEAAAEMAKNERKEGEAEDKEAEPEPEEEKVMSYDAYLAQQA